MHFEKGANQDIRMLISLIECEILLGNHAKAGELFKKLKHSNIKNTLILNKMQKIEQYLKTREE